MKVLLFLALGVFYLVHGSENLKDSQVGDFAPSSSDIHTRAKRTVMIKQAKLWPKNVPITYGFEEGSFTDADKAFFSKQMDLFTQHTCFTLQRKDDGHRALMFVKDYVGGCGTSLGWKGPNSTHIISELDYCKFHSIPHELFHALGSGHTQYRPDRDEFLTVREGYPEAWKQDEVVEQNPPVSFDFASVMLYPAVPEAIMPRESDYFATQGWDLAPTFSDWKHLNLRYKCNEECPQPVKCENGGYQHPRTCNQCVCTDFYSGTRCEKYEGYTIAMGQQQVLGDAGPFNETAYKLQTEYITKDFTLFKKFKSHAVKGPVGKKLYVTINKMAPSRALQNPCPDTCRQIAMEIVDTKEGDLTMGGKFFCCESRTGYSFISHSNIIGYRGWAPPGWDHDFQITVEVYDGAIHITEYLITDILYIKTGSNLPYYPTYFKVIEELEEPVKEANKTIHKVKLVLTECRIGSDEVNITIKDKCKEKVGSDGKKTYEYLIITREQRAYNVKYSAVTYKPDGVV